jgi:hypothetical protein
MTDNPKCNIKIEINVIADSETQAATIVNKMLYRVPIESVFNLNWDYQRRNWKLCLTVDESTKE